MELLFWLLMGVLNSLAVGLGIGLGITLGLWLLFRNTTLWADLKRVLSAKHVVERKAVRRGS